VVSGADGASAARGGPHRTEIQMRFSDTDALGHVNNGSFALYAETARIDFLRLIESGVRSLILAHLSIDFRRQVKFGDTVQVDTAVERIGRSSVTLRQAVLANGEVAAEVGSVVVLFDYATQRPVALPPTAREQLERFLAPAATPG
jgi:acyl-CoA thioester hydrolase